MFTAQLREPLRPSIYLSPEDVRLLRKVLETATVLKPVLGNANGLRGDMARIMVHQFRPGITQSQILEMALRRFCELYERTWQFQLRDRTVTDCATYFAARASAVADVLGCRLVSAEVLHVIDLEPNVRKVTGIILLEKRCFTPNIAATLVDNSVGSPPLQMIL